MMLHLADGPFDKVWLIEGNRKIHALGKVFTDVLKLILDPIYNLDSICPWLFLNAHAYRSYTVETSPKKYYLHYKQQLRKGQKKDWKV